jgi:hypothetical protein
MNNNIGIYIWFSIITIVAIIIGPILAVQAETYLSRRREQRERRLQVFKTLMLTRKIPLSPNRIDALNLIDIYFDKDDEVTKGWRAYFDTLNNVYKEGISDDETKRLNDKSEEKFIDLLDAMSKAVGYKKFDKTYLKNAVYFPQAYSGYVEGQIDANKNIGLMMNTISQALSQKTVKDGNQENKL